MRGARGGITRPRVSLERVVPPVAVVFAAATTEQRARRENGGVGGDGGERLRGVVARRAGRHVAVLDAVRVAERPGR